MAALSCLTRRFARGHIASVRSIGTGTRRRDLLISHNAAARHCSGLRARWGMSEHL